MGYTISRSNSELIYTNDSNVFASSVVLFERYDNYSFPLVVAPSIGCTDYIPCIDYNLKQRSRGSVYLDELMRIEEEKMSHVPGQDKRKHHRMSAEENAANDELLGIPPTLRDFINRLPSQLPSHMSVTSTHIDGFIDNLRRAVLPPRPYSEYATEADKSDHPSGTGSGPGTNGSMGTNSILNMNVEEEEDEDITFENVDDIFQQRQKMRLNM